MACPFFMPTNRFDDGGWLHPSRLPLGSGWRGECWAPGQSGRIPSDQELRENCNLGYAVSCSRIPQERPCDAVRFSVTRDFCDQLEICFVFEAGHRPAGHGTLEYDLAHQRWVTTHPDGRIQKMAECYLQSYLLRRIRPASAGPNSSTNS